MRVISGLAKGIPLRCLDGVATRPTIDRVKEAMFSILQFDLPGARVLDLFAGSGSLGIEALSRGAACCDFVESSPQAMEIVRANLHKTGLAGGAFHQMDAFFFLEQCTTPYDVILLDPPYHQQLCDKAMQSIFKNRLLGKILVCETSREEEIKSPYVLQKQRIYGSVKLSVWTAEEDR